MININCFGGSFSNLVLDATRSALGTTRSVLDIKLNDFCVRVFEFIKLSSREILNQKEIIANCHKGKAALLQSLEGSLFWNKFKLNLYINQRTQKIAFIIPLIGARFLQVATNEPKLEKELYAANAHSSVQFTAAIEAKKTKVLNSLIRVCLFSTQEKILDEYPVCGACFGMLIRFLSQCFKGDSSNLEQLLKTVAVEYAAGPGVSAIAVQQVYNSITLSMLPANPVTTHDLDFDRRHLFYKIQGLRITELPHLGIPGRVSDRQYLEEWLNETDGYTNGYYELGIKCVNGDAHSFGLVKDPNQVYLWDPCLGLVKCARSQSVEIITKYLIRFWGDKENHCISIVHVQREEDVQFEKRAKHLGKCKTAIAAFNKGQECLKKHQVVVARRWYELSAEEGYYPSALRAGRIWQEGSGNALISFAQAIKYLKIAAVECAGWMGIEAADRLSKLESNQNAAKEWSEKARLWAKKLEEKRKYVACCQAKFDADCKEFGEARAIKRAYNTGHSLISIEAFHVHCWLEFAADKGHPLAALETAELYLRDPIDKFSALRYFTKAAIKNTAHGVRAARALADLYNISFADRTMGRLWLKDAEEWGKKAAEDKLTGSNL